MSSKGKVILIIVILIIAVVCCMMVLKGRNTQEEVAEENEIQNTEIIEENIVEENTVENEVIEENVVEENLFQNSELIDTDSQKESTYQTTIYDTDDTVGTTDKKQEAINLVKAAWGEDDTVTFKCDSITNDGIYIIAVVSTQTASVKNYFRVDLTAKTVTVDY